MNMVNRMLVNKGSPLANLYSNRSVTGIPDKNLTQVLHACGHCPLASGLWFCFWHALATPPLTHQSLCRPQCYTPSLLQTTIMD